MARQKRSTTGRAAVPFYRGSACAEAARHLRLTVARYLAGRELFRTVTEAYEMLREEVAREAGK